MFLHRGDRRAPVPAQLSCWPRVEVAGASMEHGLPHIDPHRAVPDSVVPTIRINGARA